MNKKIKILDRQNGFQRFFRIDVLRFQHSLYAGGMSKPIERELFGRGQAAILLLYDLQSQHVALIEQCRAGALGYALESGHCSQAWLLEPIAGMIDGDERPLDAAIREAEEEAGAVIDDAEFIAEFFPSPGGSDEKLHLFAAEISMDKVADFAGLEEEEEDIRVVKLSFDEAKRRLFAQEFNVASTIISLQWLFFQKLAQK